MRVDPLSKPLLACAMLSILAIVQIAAPSQSRLPDEPSVLPRRARPIPITPLVASAQVLQTPLFAPGRGGGGSGGAGDGLTLNGVVISNRYAAAILRLADGSTVTAPRGRRVDGWTVAAVSPTQVLLLKGPERRVLRVGAPAAPASPSGPSAIPDSDED